MTFLSSALIQRPTARAAALAVAAIGLLAVGASAQQGRPGNNGSQNAANPNGGKSGAGKPGAGKPAGGKPAKPKGGKPGGGKAGGRPAFRAMGVGVDAVRNGPLQETTPVIGRVVGREGGVISARTAGPVEQIHVHAGDRVKKGQILAVLVTERLRAQVALQQAEVRLAQQELARLERLRQNRSAAFPRARYDDAVQKLVKAQANLRIAKLALSYAFIRAPYPGVITMKHTEAGAYLRQGDRVVTMVNDRNLELEADVPVTRIVGLAPNRKVMVSVGGKSLPVTVRAVIPEQSALTRTVAVRFRVGWDLSKIRVAINQNVTLQVPVGEAKTAISVHKDAVISRGPAKMVFVVVRKPKGPPIALPRLVLLGQAVGSRFVVLRGLKPGEIVIVRGNERVRPGMPVRPMRRPG